MQKENLQTAKLLTIFHYNAVDYKRNDIAVLGVGKLNVLINLSPLKLAK